VAAPTPLAFCITDLDPGGAERALVQIVRRLDLTEWSPAVYCLGGRGSLADELDQLDIPTTCLGATSVRSLGVVWKLRSLLKAQRPALLQTFLFHANMVGRVAAKLAGVPTVVAGIRVAERERRRHLKLERLPRGLVDHYVCVSQSVAKFAIAECRLPQDNVSVIPNGVDFDRFNNAPPADLSRFAIPSGATTLLFVGRLHPQKGLLVLLDAVEPLLHSQSDLHVLVVGSGPLDAACRERVANAHQESRIHFAGPQEDIAGLMRASSALVLPSLWEGLPNVVLEAMAAKRPVIATTVDGTAELVTENQTGWVAEAGSAESLRNAIQRFLQATPAARAAITNRSQVTVQEKFTWNRCAETHASLYRQLLAPPQGN